MSTIAVLDAVKMAGLALVSVGLWTLRVALTARGRRIAGAATAAVEASVFAVVFASLVSDLDQPGRVAGYALGVAMGTLLGISADKRMSRGISSVRIVVEGADAPLVHALRGRGWPATAMAASGLRGPATLLLIAVDDHCLESLLDVVQHLAPDAFWTVERLQDAHFVELGTRFVQLGGARRPKHAPEGSNRRPSKSAVDSGRRSAVTIRRRPARGSQCERSDTAHQGAAPDRPAPSRLVQPGYVSEPEGGPVPNAEYHELSRAAC